MNLEIVIPNIKPLLSNHATKITTRGKYPTKYKTHEAQQFESKINSFMVNNKSKFRKFNNSYDRCKHYVIVDFKFYIPLFTKDGLISMKSGDWDGYIKYTQDSVLKHLSFDDSQIIGGSAYKIHSDKYKICITLQIRSIDNIRQVNHT